MHSMLVCTASRWSFCSWYPFRQCFCPHCEPCRLIPSRLCATNSAPGQRSAVAGPVETCHGRDDIYSFHQAGSALILSDIVSEYLLRFPNEPGITGLPFLL